MSQLHDRLNHAAGSRSYRHLSELTGTNAETVRRYMQGQSPSIEFITSLCRSLSISAEWVLTGRGPMRRDDVRRHALREAEASELLGAMAETLDRLIDRVERLELFVQMLDIRLRAHPGVETRGIHAFEPSTGADTVARARSVADALPQRPPPTRA